MSDRNSKIEMIPSDQRAYVFIRKLILSRKVDEGARLKYAELTKMLKMSKTPIVSALSRLKKEGLVQHKQNSGYKVANISDGHLAQDVRLDIASSDGVENPFLVGDDQVGNPPEASLNQVVYDAIKDSIVKLRFAPGQKLVYSDLEAELGVSKTPIISALARLEIEGYVYRKRNAGFYIRKYNLKELKELFQAREALELANADFIMNSFTANDLVELEKIHREFASDSPYVYDDLRVKINRKFHLRLAALSRNGFILKYIQEIFDLLDLRTNMRFEFLPPDRVKEIHCEHQQILEALQNRDKARLKRILKKHLKSPVNDIIRYLNLDQNF